MNAERAFYLERGFHEPYSFLKMSDCENAWSHPVRLLPRCLNTFPLYNSFYKLQLTEKFLTRTKREEILKPLLNVYKSEFSFDVSCHQQLKSTAT